MNTVKNTDLINFIPKSDFDICKIDGKLKHQIINSFPRREDGLYYLNKFINYVKNKYNISIQEYVEIFLKKSWPTCPVSNEKVGYRVNGKGLFFSKFKRGKVCKEHSEAFRNACNKLSKERFGKNNPMFGKKSWNSGLTKNEDARIKKIADKRLGIEFSNSHKEKLKKARSNHPLKARHTNKHSEESKEKMRKATIKRWQNGCFDFKKTSIEKKVEHWLSDNKIDYIYQYSIGGFIADFACEKNKILIECQGDFFHCNPTIDKYSTPQYDVQKRNVFRDSIKKQIYKDLGWKLIELWESDINSGDFKNILQCELKK
jgi:hypothetical protein